MSAALDPEYNSRRLLGDVVGQTAAQDFVTSVNVLPSPNGGFTVEKATYKRSDYIKNNTAAGPITIVVPESLPFEQRQQIERNNEALRQQYLQNFGLPLVPTVTPAPVSEAVAIDPPSQSRITYEQELALDKLIESQQSADKPSSVAVPNEPVAVSTVLGIPWLFTQPAKPTILIKFDYGNFNFKCSRHEAFYDDKTRRLLVFSDTRYDFPEIAASPAVGSVFTVTVLPDTQYESSYVCLADETFSIQLGPVIIDVYSAVPQGEFPSIVD